MIKKITICHISESTSGGVFTHLKQLSSFLDPNQFDQTFVLSSLKGEGLRSQKTFNGHRLIVIDMVRNIHPLKDFKSLILLIKFLRKEKFDIIHCHSSKAGVLGRLAARFSGHRVVVYTPHAFSFHSYLSPLKNVFYQIVERMMGKQTSKIICVSQGEYLQALKANIATPEKLVVIENGIEIRSHSVPKNKRKWLQSLGYTGEEYVIGFVGRLVPQKNPEMLIKSCKGLSVNNFIVFILGDGELREQLIKLTRSLGLQKKVLFLGHQNNVKEFLNLFDVFVSTSLWESMPYSILEAIAEGVPIVATNIPGVTDLIKHGETGMLVSPNNEDELKEVLEQLWVNSMLRHNLSKKAIQLVQRNYHVKDMINKLQGLYFQLDKLE